MHVRTLHAGAVPAPRVWFGGLPPPVHLPQPRAGARGARGGPGGTFRPIETERVEDHPMHAEEYCLSPATKSVLNDSSAKRLAIGTTCVRAIEHYLASDDIDVTAPTRRDARLFIRPPYTFLGVDHLLTNFHLPGSTLLCLVSAFLTPGCPDGLEQLKEIYHQAIKKKYRLFSYGDALLII